MILSILIALISIIGLVVLHEFGHFIIAQKFGVKVEEFGVGYPPRLFGKKIGETLYSLNLLPFGAFVKISGADSDENSTLEDYRKFTGKPAWQRALILFGGAVSFWIIAAILLSFVFGMGAPVAISDEEEGILVNPKVQILAIFPGSPAEKAGIKMGDAIKELRINDYELGITKVKEIQEFTEKYKKNFTLLATPAEQAAGRFAGYDQKIYGKLPGITDREYYTNSFHIPVDFEISAWEKMALESPYQKPCNAGHISYVELDASPEHNLAAIDKLLRHAQSSDAGYVGINFPIDECLDCHFYGLIDKNEDKCPQCGSTHIRRIRRITGYLGDLLTRFGASKAAEARDRRTHKL